jgi:hypothetical protein
MKLSKLFFVLVVALPLAFFACGDDGDGDGGNNNNIVNNNNQNQNNNNNNAVDVQLDRVGRPAITTALVGTFEATSVADKDAYNADSNVAGWAAAWTDKIAFSVGILDGVDEVCGNSFAYDGTTYYAPLGGVLADDRLILSFAATNGPGYLGYEANGNDGDYAGGRTLTDDVVDTSYTVLSGATVTDGVDADEDEGEILADFPYLPPVQ